MANNTEVTYEIIEHIGELGKRGDWTREVNIVAWNGGVPKVDIREWSPNHKRMARGRIKVTKTLISSTFYEKKK